MHQCAVCSFPCRSVSISPGGGRFEYDCFRCGKYAIGSEGKLLVAARNFSDVQIANLSGYIRQNPGVLILSRDLDRLGALPTPTADEKAATLLMAIARENPQPGTRIEVAWQRLDIDLHLTEAVRQGDGEYPNDSFTDQGRKASKWMGFASAASPDELRYFAGDFLSGEGFLAPSGNTVLITPKGWQRVAELKHTQSKSSQAFVAMSFAPQFNELFSLGIEPGIIAAGYRALRIDREEHNNNIDDEIIAAIRQTKFLVADFTDNRAGVYYEAGFALGLGHEVIRTVRHDQLSDVHFDVRQANFIAWETSALPALATALKNRIEAAIGRGPVTT